MECLKDTLLRQALSFLANIRLGCKSFPETNTLAYYENSYITDEPNVMKPVLSVS